MNRSKVHFFFQGKDFWNVPRKKIYAITLSDYQREVHYSTFWSSFFTTSFKSCLKCGASPKQMKYTHFFSPHENWLAILLSGNIAWNNLLVPLHDLYRGFIGVMIHYHFQCPQSFCPQHLITSDTFFHHQWTRWTRNILCGVELTVFAVFKWSGFWNYFGIITFSCWSLRRNAKKIWNACCLLMTFSGMSAFDVFFRSSDLWVPTLPCSKCQHPSCTRCIVPCACHPWLLVATLYTVISEATSCWKHTCPLFLIFHSWNKTQTINTNPNKEAPDAHGFSQKEQIVQNIS